MCKAHRRCLRACVSVCACLKLVSSCPRRQSSPVGRTCYVPGHSGAQGAADLQVLEAAHDGLEPQGDGAAFVGEKPVKNNCSQPQNAHKGINMSRKTLMRRR